MGVVFFELVTLKCPFTTKDSILNFNYDHELVENTAVAEMFKNIFIEYHSRMNSKDICKTLAVIIEGLEKEKAE